MILNSVMNGLGNIADAKVESIACIGWIHSPKPPAEMLKPKQEEKK
jgi:cyclic lactone autoinducer peptide